MSMIQIEKITKIGNRYEAIANDGKDYGTEISATILLRAAEGWNGKTKLYFNDETNKWTRVAEFPDPKAPKAAKAPSVAASAKRSKAAKIVKAKLEQTTKVTPEGTYEMSETPNGGFSVVKYTAPVE